MDERRKTPGTLLIRRICRPKHVLVGETPLAQNLGLRQVSICHVLEELYSIRAMMGIGITVLQRQPQNIISYEDGASI